MELKFLGRGSAFNVEEGNTAAYFKIDKNLILIDCSELIFERLITKKILDDVDDIYVFITHLHSDHVGSLPSLINYAYYILKTKINIIYPDYSNNNICSSLGSNMVTNNKYDIISVVQFNHIFEYVLNVRSNDECHCDTTLYGYFFSHINNNSFLLHW